jgi:hypothetical protein
MKNFLSPLVKNIPNRHPGIGRTAMTHISVPVFTKRIQAQVKPLVLMTEGLSRTTETALEIGRQTVAKTDAEIGGFVV